MRLGTILSCALAIAVAAGAHAQKNSLSVGDKAPGLDIEEWIKGEETTIESDKVYVVEFWATWCGPCRKSIPHLTKLQQQYGDDGLTIIGISNEETEVVRRFVEKQRDKMDYTVAVDRRATTKRAWFDAAGRKGIPSAFIVDRNATIAFIGHPMDEEFDRVLSQVMRGRFNSKLAKEAAPMIEAARRARGVRNWRMAIKHYDEIIELDSRVFADIALERLEMLAVDMEDREAAYRYATGELIGKHFADDAGALQMLAAMIATHHRIDPEHRDLDVALEAAEVSRRIAGPNDAEAMATLALVRFHRGEHQDAIDAQKRAYFLAKPGKKAEYRRVLTSYQDSAGRASR